MATSTASNKATSCTAIVTSVNEQLIVVLPDDASAALPSRGQVAATGTIDGQPFDTVVEPDGRRGHWLKLANLRPKPANVAEGQTVELTLAPASEWPEPDVPDDLRSALDDAPDLDELWTSITSMARWEWVRWVCSTRNEETRARRVEVTISKMRDGKRRPCCFDLSACTDVDVATGGKLPA